MRGCVRGLGHGDSSAPRRDAVSVGNGVGVSWFLCPLPSDISGCCMQHAIAGAGPPESCCRALRGAVRAVRRLCVLHDVAHITAPCAPVGSSYDVDCCRAGVSAAFAADRRASSPLPMMAVCERAAMRACYAVPHACAVDACSSRRHPPRDVPLFNRFPLQPHRWRSHCLRRAVPRGNADKVTASQNRGRVMVWSWWDSM